MEYRRLGRAGLKVSALSYGSWVTFSFQLDGSAALDCMRTAYEAGVNFFDNAEVYAGGESERLMGAALHELGWARDTFCVSSKVFWGGDLPTQKGLHRKHVRDACDAALARLRVDYLDLFFCHRPDFDTPIEETVRAMDELIRAGKVLYWGTSEWSAQQIQQAYGIARECGLAPPTMEQPEYNLFHRERVEREYARLYDEIGLGTTIWSPLASGVLTGKYGKGVPENSRMALDDYAWLKERILDSDAGRAKLAKADRLAELAREIGLTPAQLAIAWCLENPNVSTVILGASKAEQIRENLQALDLRPKLTPEVHERIEAIVQNRPEPAPRF